MLSLLRVGKATDFRFSKRNFLGTKIRLALRKVDLFGYNAIDDDNALKRYKVEYFHVEQGSGA